MRLGVCAMVTLLIAAGCGGDEEKPLIAASKTAVVRGELVPSVHLFGEPVVARVDVILNRDKVDPDEVRLKANFDPYAKVGETHEEHQDIGEFTVIRYTTTLRCLEEDCIPPTVGNVTVSQTPELPIFPEAQNRDYQRRYEFPPAVVIAGAEPKDKTLGRVVWAPLRSLSRINWNDPSIVGQGFPFVATVAPLPDPGYRIPPILVGLGLLVFAAGLLALPVWLVVRLQRRRAIPDTEPGPLLSPLERALRLVEWASRRQSVDERREALEALAFELGHEEDGDSARLAREHGWSPPAPDSDAMTELVTAVRENDAHST